MIGKITVKNFMAYEDETIDLQGKSSVEIVGKNGSGKSALLEAVIYALYGITRATMSDVSRRKGDGSHEVSVLLTDVSVPGDFLEVVRGRTAGGSGYGKVKYNGNVIADGPSEMNSAIAERLQMDSVMYLSSIFFGLSDEKKGDKMISVTPAARLENHQSLANVSVYRTWKKQVDSAIKPMITVHDELKGKIEAYTSTLKEGSISDYKKEIDSWLVDQDNIQSEIDSINLSEMRAKLDRFKTIKQTIDSLEEKIEEYSGIISASEESIEEDREELSRIVDSIKDTSDQLKSVEGEIKKAPETERLYTEKDSIKESMERIKTNILLRETAVGAHVSDCACPLCSSTVSDSQISIWKSEIDTYTDGMKSLKSQLRDVEERISHVEALGTKRAKLLASKENKVSKQSVLDAAIKKAENTMKNTKAILTEDKNKLESQKLKFDEAAYKKIYGEIKEAEAKIEELGDRKTYRSNKISVNREKIKNIELTKKKLSGADESLKKLKIKIRRHKILSAAFSKQGIPMDLLKWFNDELQRRASDVYKHFRNGFITIEEVPGKQPGLVYYLSDASGKRLIASLSKGEKMLVFVSLRVALTQLLCAVSGVQVDYLVLDEIAANLDEENRDMLIGLVNGVLSKFYKQIIMVSHSSVRDVFVLTLNVEKNTDGISTVRVG
jgi:DNA repair protein SbcC/Rad50